MLTLPETLERPERPYIFVSFTLTMAQMQQPARDGFPQLFAYLDRQGLKPAGAPFYNYRRIDMSATLDVEAGIEVDRPVRGEGAVQAGILPSGRFLGLAWHGHPDQLMVVTGMLIGWARLTQQDFDMHTAPDGDHFACRLEYYESDPAQVPDMTQWVTRLAFKLRS